MKKLRGSAGWIFVTLILVVFFAAIYVLPNYSLTAPLSPFAPSPSLNREIVEYSLSEERTLPEQYNIPGNKLPEFTFDIAAPKFQEILQSSGDALNEKAKAKITYQGSGKGDNTFDADIQVNTEKSKLVVHPNDIPNFTPGKYRLSLTLRTIEGEVNIEQDFTWGVIAVNTDKSIYKPGETAEIGFGILDDGGNTQCVDTADIVTTITSPEGKVTELSTNTGTIRDSGKCGAITFTNKADFQAQYKTSTSGIYQMHVTASIKGGPMRTIDDYFKVDSDVPFDITRNDFPTRIYPGSPYPVAFKVVPKEAYRGKIEEFVPKNFQVVSINNRGRIEDVGLYKKITWDVNLTAGEVSYYSYIIKFPMISPEFYLLGPITIGTFKEARQWQVASDAINSSTGLLSYEDNGGSNTWSRVWNGTAFNAQASMSTTPADSRWFSEQSSPINNEKLVALVDNAGVSPNIDPLYMFRWDGAAWNLDFSIGFTCQQDASRKFDIAYEETSGDALLVYNDCTSQLKYRKRASGAWDGSSSNAGTAYDTTKSWIKLKAKPNTDDILVGILNANRRVGAMVWDGASNTFGTQLADSSGTSSQTNTITEESMGIAWENSSGKALLVYGSTTTTLLYRELNGTWGGENTAYTGLAGPVAWLSVSGDIQLNSDYVAVGIVTATTIRNEFGVWNGATWVTKPTAVTARSIQDKAMSVNWEASTSAKAIWAYSTNAGGTTPRQLSYRTWTNPGGVSTFGADTILTGTLGTNILTIELYSDTNSRGIIALIVDNNGALWDRNWDGSSWSALPGAALIASIQSAGDNAQAFGFGFDRFLETLAAYKFFANTNSTDVGVALGAQDSPIIFSTANPEFRLRMLLYIDPDDSVAIGARLYTLQYVDPGVGSCAAPSGGTPASWTDVGTGVSTLIAYNNNATPTDGSNLTTNASDPTYNGKTVRAQTYEESNTFANSTSAIAGDQVGLWDFSLKDNTTYDIDSQTFCFRVKNNSGRVIKTPSYPQITTAGTPDVLIQGGSIIQGGTILQ